MKEKVLPSMALPENINHLVYTAENELISISALNTDDSEAIDESMLLHGVFKAGVNVKAALTSLNTAFLPVSRSHFTRR